jgi:hypothetical protein
MRAARIDQHDAAVTPAGCAFDKLTQRFKYFRHRMAARHHFEQPLFAGEQSFSRMLSIIEGRPRAPGLRSMALRPTAPSASSTRLRDCDGSIFHKQSRQLVKESDQRSHGNASLLGDNDDCSILSGPRNTATLTNPRPGFLEEPEQSSRHRRVLFLATGYADNLTKCGQSAQSKISRDGRE